MVFLSYWREVYRESYLEMRRLLGLTWVSVVKILLIVFVVLIGLSKWRGMDFAIDNAIAGFWPNLAAIFVLFFLAPILALFNLFRVIPTRDERQRRELASLEAEKRFLEEERKPRLKITFDNDNPTCRQKRPYPEGEYGYTEQVIYRARVYNSGSTSIESPTVRLVNLSPPIVFPPMGAALHRIFDEHTPLNPGTSTYFEVVMLSYPVPMGTHDMFGRQVPPVEDEEPDLIFYFKETRLRSPVLLTDYTLKIEASGTHTQPCEARFRFYKAENGEYRFEMMEG